MAENDPRKNDDWLDLPREERTEALLKAIIDNQLARDQGERTPELAAMSVGG
jgi:hypothetical protein